ncbi:hypothetical protein [Streptomyces sp. GC420]|uniref:hypothetical protein n=1 Tax=Streptomyces sp. GC420 TaxID=2697568 RepID=UPI0014152F0C|nr:hypothetical protein [Streptomyces sp. GC420]NBM19753.1 hypothetical protein [Streptomyces sp. GC420]
MASKESAPAGESAEDSPVRRAAALAVLTEEPTAGLFPATASAAPASTAVPASPAAAVSPAVATSSSGTAAVPVAVSPVATAVAVAAPTTETAVEESTASAEEVGLGSAAATVGEAAAATAATAATGTAGTVTATTETAGTPAATAATAATEGGAAAAQARGDAESAPESRLTTAARSGASGGGTSAPPLGRPGKPLIAAAVLGGLILVAVPFLITGSDDEHRRKAAGAPAGSSMNPYGSAPGIVPDEERVSVPGTDDGGERRPSKGPGTSGKAEGGTGPVGGIHESGTGGEGRGDKSGTAKNTSTSKGSTRTSRKQTDDAEADPTPSQRTSAKPTPAPVTYAHLIGPGCETPGFAGGDMYHDGAVGWRGSRGSTTSYGCSGFYYSLPMSGSSSPNGVWAQWKFTTGSVEKGTCAVRVYIPNVRDISYVGGTPAHYTVYRYFAQTSGNKVGTFQINQPAHLGQWVSAGTFPITANKISVVLDNRGSKADNRHAAAAPVRVDCTAS